MPMEDEESEEEDEEELEEEEEGWGDREFVSDVSGDEDEDGLSDLEDVFVRSVNVTDICQNLTILFSVITRRRGLFRRRRWRRGRIRGRGRRRGFQTQSGFG